MFFIHNGVAGTVLVVSIMLRLIADGFIFPFPDSPSQFGEARLLNDAIRALEGGSRPAEVSTSNKPAANQELSLIAPQTNSTMIGMISL